MASWYVHFYIRYNLIYSWYPYLVTISMNVTTMGLKFRFFPRQFIFFFCAFRHRWWKSSRPASTSFDSRKTFVLSRRLFYRYRRSDALCFANRAPLVEANRPAFSVGSYSNYLKVLHRSAYFFHCSVAANAYRYILSLLFAKNFTRYRNKWKWMATFVGDNINTSPFVYLFHQTGIMNNR